MKPSHPPGTAKPALLSLLGTCLLVGGCGHGDAIIFASNKQIGVKVGVNSEQIPEVSVGYNGQDLAFVPLHKKDPKGTNANQIIAEGKYRATTDGTDQDAYSVYGSFAGMAGGSGKGVPSGSAEVGAKLSLSQFFATGMAAQLLAKESGAQALNPFATAPAEAKAAAEATAQAEAEAREVHQERLARELVAETMGKNSADPQVRTNERKRHVRTILRLGPQLADELLTEAVLADRDQLLSELTDPIHYQALKEHYRGK